MNRPTLESESVTASGLTAVKRHRASLLLVILFMMRPNRVQILLLLDENTSIYTIRLLSVPPEVCFTRNNMHYYPKHPQAVYC